MLINLCNKLLHDQHHIKQYYDSHQREMTCQGVLAPLKLQPYHRIGPQASTKVGFSLLLSFSSAQRTGHIAYKLDLPAAANLCSVFHVSSLKKLKVSKHVKSFFPWIQQGVPLPSPAAQLDSRVCDGQHKDLIHWEDLSLADTSWELVHQFALQAQIFFWGRGVENCYEL